MRRDSAPPARALTRANRSPFRLPDLPQTPQQPRGIPRGCWPCFVNSSPHKAARRRAAWPTSAVPWEDRSCSHGSRRSLERLIEQNKERDYETLEQSSIGWHDGKHGAWPYVNSLLVILKTAFREFEERVGQTGEPRGAKTQLVAQAIGKAKGSFSIGELQRECLGDGLDLIRATLKRLRAEGRVECLGRGQHARWQRTGQWELGFTGVFGRFVVNNNVT